VQTDEHQENDADFGELTRKMGVSEKSGCKRAERHTCEKIAHKRRQAQLVGEQAAEERKHQAHGSRSDKRDVV
jgi:hypothetical protein